MTKEEMEAIRKDFAEAKKEWQREHDDLWRTMPEELKLAAADVIFRAINDNAEIGGTFRKLIYDGLGFRIGGAYTVLYCAGGMNITNFLEIPKYETPKDDQT